jgi:hypothetical protein
MWMASATPDTERMRSVEPGSITSDAFRRAPDASWISLILEPPRPILHVSAVRSANLHAAHAGVGNDKLDGDGARAGDRCHVEWLVVDAADNEAECLRRSAHLPSALATHLGHGVEGAKDV